MTRGEMIKWLKKLNSKPYSNFPYKPMKEALDMAIEELEQESCEDCISRKAILDCQYTIDESETLGISTRAVVNVDDILNAKPIQSKTGHWIEVAKYSNGKHEIKCSECRSHIIDRGHANSYVVKEKYKYCPRCGARMIEPQESEDKE